MFRIKSHLQAGATLTSYQLTTQTHAPPLKATNEYRDMASTTLFFSVFSSFLRPGEGLSSVENGMISASRTSLEWHYLPSICAEVAFAIQVLVKCRGAGNVQESTRNLAGRVI